MKVEYKHKVHLYLQKREDFERFKRHFKGELYETKKGTYFFINDLGTLFDIGKDILLASQIYQYDEINITLGEYE